MLDLLRALSATGASLQLDASNFVQPEFSNTLAVQQGMHPILQMMRVAEGNSVIPNDIVRTA